MPERENNINIKANFLTLFIGLLGALVGYLLNIPLGPMLGALIFVFISKLASLPLTLSKHYSSFALYLGGIFMGSRFPHNFLEDFFIWHVSILTIPLFVIFCVLFVSFYLKIFAKYDLSTAILSGFPGGILTMVSLGAETKGREDTILSTHTLRIVMTVFVMPFALVYYGYEITENISSKAQILNYSNLSLFEIVMMILVSIISLIIARFLKLPAGDLVGPMFGVGYLYAAKIISGELPPIILIFVLWILGSNLGLRFPRLDLNSFLKLFIHGCIIFALLFLLSLLFTFFLLPFSNETGLSIFLAFAPGGLGEMATIGVIFGANPAFISVHHVVRVIFCALLAIFLSKRFLIK
jgi:membrane AbrB-like protein